MSRNTTAKRKRVDNRRLWVVECHFKDGNGAWGWDGGSWGICSFSERPFTSENFYDCHKLKRNIAVYLTSNYAVWDMKDFRVSAYIPKKDISMVYDDNENASRWVRKRIIRVE